MFKIHFAWNSNFEFLLYFHKFMQRVATTKFVRDVDYAFQGKNQGHTTYWISQVSMLFFCIVRAILVQNTPYVVHVPRITLQQSEMPSDDHYQFRDSSIIKCKTYKHKQGLYLDSDCDNLRRDFPWDKFSLYHLTR